jgi:hypothetical protein
VNSPWLDELAWEFLQPTAIGGYLADRYGNWTVAGTIEAARNLAQVLDEVQGNGSHELIFAHVILPHPPTLVDAECGLLRASDASSLDLSSVEANSQPDDRFSGQLACVDRLITQVVAHLEPSTGMLLTADHGTAIGGQIDRPPSTWSDADIAERFGILLAYRMPPECKRPVAATNVDAMRALIGCAVTTEMPPRQTGYLIGAIDPEWVDPDRMTSIQERMRSGDVLRTTD